MKKNRIVLLPLLIGIMVLSVAGCNGSSSTEDGLSGFIDITGSNTVTPISTLYAEEFMSANPQVNVAVSGPGSGAGIAALINGTTDICQSSRPIKQSEIDQALSNGINVTETRIATDAIAVIVLPSNPVSELTVEQLSGIYTGAITNWKQLGGLDASIVALARDTNSGTHVYFKEAIVQMDGLPGKDTSLEYGGAVQLLPSTSTGVTQVSQNQNAIFYIGLGYMDDTVKALGIKKTSSSSAVLPSLQTALDNTYPISRGLYYYTDGEPGGLIKAFVDYALSDKGQELVESAGFVPVAK
mgnify:CR=1 FL=1